MRILHRLPNRGLLSILGGTVLAFSILSPSFRTAGNFENVLVGFSHMGILAIGEAFPILLGGIDLSVGSILALAGMICFDLLLVFHWPGEDRSAGDVGGGDCCRRGQWAPHRLRPAATVHCDASDNGSLSGIDLRDLRSTDLSGSSRRPRSKIASCLALTIFLAGSLTRSLSWRSFVRSRNWRSPSQNSAGTFIQSGAMSRPLGFPAFALAEPLSRPMRFLDFALVWRPFCSSHE